MLTTRTTRTDPKLAALGAAFGSAGAPMRDLQAVATLFDEAWIAPGERIITEGDPGRELFLILDGEAAVTVHDRPIATVGPGEFVGEMALFERAPRSATVTALTPMRTLVAGAQAFATLLNDAAVLRRMAATLARRLRASQGSPNY